MDQTVSQMTRDELQQLIENSVERTILDLLGDPDVGLLLRDSVRKQLLKGKTAAETGERGRPLEDVVRELGLA